jgi:hypothetical protein
MKKIILSLLILVVFVPIEYYFALQAYYTVGWIGPGLFLIASWISILLAIVFLMTDYQKTAVAILISGILAIVPFNIHYSNELLKLKTQSDTIVHYAYQVKLKTNTFPKKLAIKYNSRIRYYCENDSSFSVSFFVASTNTGYFYTPKDGWCYMDD